MPKRQRTGSSSWTARAYSTNNASTQTVSSGKKKRTYYKAKGTKKPTAKSNARAIQKLKKEKEAKWYYTLVQNWGISEISPNITNLVNVPVSTGPSDVNGRLGDKVTAKYINVHGKLFYRGLQRDPSRVTVLLVKSKMDTGSQIQPPTFANLYDLASLGTSGLPATSAFRKINDEALEKITILKRRDFMLAPSDSNYLSGGIAPNQTQLASRSVYPSVVHFKLEHKCMDAGITYESGTATPLNQHYWLMVISDDAGTSPNVGPYISYIAKFRFSDAGG